MIKKIKIELSDEQLGVIKWGLDLALKQFETLGLTERARISNELLTEIKKTEREKHR